MTFHEILETAVKMNASDIFLKEGDIPWVRVTGKMQSLQGSSMTSEQMEEIFNTVVPTASQSILEQTGAVDLAYMPTQNKDGQVQGFKPESKDEESKPPIRMRVNVFKQMGRLSMVFRNIKSKIPDFEELNLPTEPLRNLATRPRGLVLVTGIAGSGKSTTLAAMIEYINQNFEKHVVTIEDPIEYLFESKRSLIQQREIGHDTPSYAEALKHILRQSPDIILVGEMRDAETMEAALNAAETGHMVFSTLHTHNTTQTVDRIINFFQPHMHQFLRDQLSLLLEGVICLRLLPTRDLSGMVPAVEIMSATPTTRELIQKGKTTDLYKAIADGKYFGCMVFNQSLNDLINRDLITIEDAYSASDRPEELKLELRGITRMIKK
jgi:twitching motility protein PilT